jgi:hypothetical protein
VEDIEVKKFSNGSGECQGKEDDKKKSGWDKDVLVGNTARATFKVLQVTHSNISSST